MGMVSVGASALAAIVILVVFGLRFSSARAAPTCKRQRVGTVDRFGAVELIAGAGSCSAARKLAGERILAAEAPVLPLDGCTERCRCAYERYADRRDINRRRGDDGLSEDFIYAGSENRSREERRA